MLLCVWCKSEFIASNLDALDDTQRNDITTCKIPRYFKEFTSGLNPLPYIAI